MKNSGREVGKSESGYTSKTVKISFLNSSLKGKILHILGIKKKIKVSCTKYYLANKTYNRSDDIETMGTKLIAIYSE